MQRGVLIFVLFIFSFMVVPGAFSQEDYQQEDVKTLRGQVTQINWPASTITVRFLQTKGYVSFDEITFFVPGSIHIAKGSSAIGLDQLQIGDQLTIEYINVSPGPLKVISMTVVIP